MPEAAIRATAPTILPLERIAPSIADLTGLPTEAVP
jgi:hypothetical protein